MIKGFIISLISLIALFANYLYTNEVNLYAKYPAEVRAGESFDVSITVEKGNLSEFGRFTQELPEGFTANSDDKLFTFSDGKVKFLWITLPAGNDYTFTYTVDVPATFVGESILSGQFAYIMDNEKRIAELPAFTVSVKPSDTPDSEMNRSEAFASNTDDNAPKEATVVAQRRLVESNGAYVVKLNVAKADLTGMAKVTETIPAGYTAEAIETADGIFTQDGSVLKFLWMNMTSEATIDVSYMLTKNNPTTSGEPVIEGNFSYSSGGVTKTVQFENVVEQTELSSEEIAKTQSVVALPKETYVNNVTYKVQIAAGHKLVNIKTYFKKKKINDRVTVIQHEGWHKYTIGKFLDYKSARDYRVKTWNNTMAKDAFVAAYNGNERITVQEALMIASHKWYQ